MKHFLIFISYLLAISFSGCNSNDEPTQPTTSSSIDIASKVLSRGGDENIDPQAIEWETIEYSGPTHIGKLTNQKVTLGSGASNGAYGVYVCDIATVWIEIDVPNPDELIIRGLNDNRCGYLPNTVIDKTPVRGTYVDIDQANGSTKQKVATTCYRIITNMAGYVYPSNYWRPCAPEDVKLIYKVGR